ncbi:MAG: FkbM family methyltransferase, partial [Planctomycetota bacterium]
MGTGTERLVGVERLGLHWRLDPESCVAQSLIEQGVWELETTKLAMDLVKPGMRVLDVGANFGYFTLLLASLVGPSGRVWAFEPVASWREQLAWHLARNGLADRVTVLPYGLSDRHASARIALAPSSATLHWTGSDAPPAWEEIELRTLDGVAAELGLERLDFVKVDLDGHEPSFLRGARVTLLALRPQLSIEFAQHCLHVAGSDVREQARLLKELGYELLDESSREPYPTEMHFLNACGNFDRSANVWAVPARELAGMPVRIFDTIDELRAELGLERPGVLLEEDLDVIENDCELYQRKRRDAELLCAIAASRPGTCLDLGTSHGRSAFKLAGNVGPEHRVYTVNMLPEQAAGSGELVTHTLSRDEIGSYYRARGASNIEQIYANTLAWDMPPGIRDLAIVFVDACHDEEAVYRDSIKAWERLSPGGFLLWHDYSPLWRRKHGWIDAVMRGVERFLADQGIEQEVLHLRNSWIGVLQKASQPCVTVEAPPAAPAAADARALRYLWVYSADSERRVQEEEAFCARIRALGYEVQPFGMPCPGGWWPYPGLDAAWRRADPELLRAYLGLEELARGADVLIAADGAMLHPGFVASLGTFNVFCCADDPESSEVLSRPVAPCFDHCFVLNQACLDLYRSWGVERVDWLLRPLRPGLMDPTMSVERILGEDRELDIVLFCERVYEVSDRAERIGRLLEAFPGAFVRGRGWPGGFLSDGEMRDAYRRARIGWNLHNSSGAFNTRLVTLPAFGVLQICDNKSDLARVFELDREVVGFDTIEECIDRTRYYLEHERERREIAARGFARVTLEHTEARMWEQIVTAISPRIEASGETEEIVVIPRAGDRSRRRPRVLMLVDMPGWAHDHKSWNLLRCLGDRLDMRKVYQSDVRLRDVATADLVLIYYWRQLESMPALESILERSLGKLLIGICSHNELEGELREPGLEVLRRNARAVFANSRLLQQEFAPLLDLPLWYLPNGVDTGFFCPGTETGGSETLRVGWAGSLRNFG